MKGAGSFLRGTAVLGIAATFGVSAMKPKPPAAAPAPATHKIAPASPGIDPQASQSFENGPCSDFEKRLQAFFLVDEKQVAAPNTCFPALKKLPANSTMLQGQARHLRFVIATLPDPLHTYFPLLFDRDAEAIQQAAQDELYVYDSSWLPWETAHADDDDKAEKRREAQEDQPGIILFRKNNRDEDPYHQPFDQGLAVLIVGEEPTAGIHRRQFENAVRWIKALQPGNDEEQRPPLQILGPSFSGSIPSLGELLHTSFDVLAAHSKSQLRIFSGNITSDRAVAWLNHLAVSPVLGPLGIQFRSFQHSDDVSIDRYCRFLSVAGTNLAHLAIVSEDETAYGGEYGTNADRAPCRPKEGQAGPVHLYYPRDISALRAAYQSQSIFSQPAVQPTADTSKRTLHDDLADPEQKNHDTIRSYSGDQTALSQEAELQQIVSLMGAHQTEYILIRSSNPLDQLFLSHFFRMTYPEGRIVIAGADLLLRRETGASGLNGVMTLSTYPLLTWEQDWTKGGLTSHKFHDHRAFPYDQAEGTYFAARFLLHESPVCAACREIASFNAESATAQTDGPSAYDGFVPSNCLAALNLPDYAPPFWMSNSSGDCHHPPTWLSVLGNGGFWPVAVMDFKTKPGLADPDRIPELGDNETRSDRLRRAAASLPNTISFLLGRRTGQAFAGNNSQALLEMPLSMKLLMLGIFLWACFHLVCCCGASVTVKPAYRAHFVRPSCSSIPDQSECDAVALSHHRYEHRVLILFASILVALVPIILAWGYGEMWEGGEPLLHPLPYRLYLPFVWLIACSAVCGNSLLENYLPKLDHDEDAVSPAKADSSKIVPGGFKDWIKEKVPEVFWLFLSFIGLSLVLYYALDLFIDRALNDANRIPTYWRAINLTTGVSPLVPLVSLIVGLYGWCWYSLQGFALFGEDRPLLPRADTLQLKGPKPDLLRMLSRKWAAEPIETLCSPFAIKPFIVGLICGVVIIAVAFLIFGYPPIRSLGSESYSVVFGLWLVLCISILLANAWQLAFIWMDLRHMLQFLDKIPLRRSLVALKGFSWGSVWKMSGNVLDRRYKLIFRQLESLTQLRGSLLAWGLKSGDLNSTDRKNASDWIKEIDETREKRVEFAAWYSSNWNNWKARRLARLKAVQWSLADTAATMLTKLLVPAWGKAGSPLISHSAGKNDKKSSEDDDGGQDKKDSSTDAVANLPTHIRDAEELVCLVYMGFIQNILGRLRSLALGMICIFVAITVSVASYPFDPRPLLSGIVVVLFVILGATIIVVYSQMHRDATLSNLMNTPPEQLGGDFWLKLLGFGAGPVLGLMASVFPEFAAFIISYVQPGIASIK
jgi:hypothetical protein